MTVSSIKEVRIMNEGNNRPSIAKPAVLVALLALSFAALSFAAPTPRDKYVFLFIGDGMAMPQISATEVYANAVASKDIKVKRLGFSQFPVAGMTTTYDAGSFITDSASAGTALSTGHKTLSGVVNMDPAKAVKYAPITELAKAIGMKIGIVTSVSLDHATPASFYAKAPSRSNYYDIAAQIATSGFDYFGGGGFLQPTGAKKDQPDVVELAKKAGYKYVNSKSEFAALKKGAGKVLAVNEKLADASSMPYEIDRAADDLSLADYTAKGIELLSDNAKGFFMMVEAGKIDWACHANDAGASINDTLALDAAVAKAVEFQAKYPKDTLIVVTGDHETGGMTLGFAGTQYSTAFDKIGKQRISFQKFSDEVMKAYKEKAKAAPADAEFADLFPVIAEDFGLGLDQLSGPQQTELQFAYSRSMGDQIVRATSDDYLLYGGYEPFTVKVTQTLNQAAGIGWTTYAHTGVPVATFAKGSGQELFANYYDNTDIFRSLASVMGISVEVKK
jgi:alkaline phosphatase